MLTEVLIEFAKAALMSAAMDEHSDTVIIEYTDESEKYIAHGNPAVVNNLIVRRSRKAVVSENGRFLTPYLCATIKDSNGMELIAHIYIHGLGKYGVELIRYANNSKNWDKIIQDLISKIKAPQSIVDAYNTANFVVL